MILRHAKAEPDAIRGDFARKLTEAGRLHAEQLGQHLNELKLIPQSVYSSSAHRALETAELVCEQLFIRASGISVRDELYLADIDTFLSLLKPLNNRINRVMLVGHNPALEDLVDYLSEAPLESDQPSGKRMLPATMVMLEFDGDWSALTAKSCQQALVVHGKLLKKP